MIEYLFRCLLLFAWSNCSISALSYLFLLSKIGDLCSLCFSKDRLSTYDSLTSYYNRIGDRFHDIGKWDQLNKEEQTFTKKNKKRKKDFPLTTTQTEDETDEFIPAKNHFKLKQINSSDQDQTNSLNNSIFVKEIKNYPDDTSSLSSLTTITNKQHHLSNGLIVTTKKHMHL
jgi:hypothetical protein